MGNDLFREQKYSEVWPCMIYSIFFNSVKRGPPDRQCSGVVPGNMPNYTDVDDTGPYPEAVEQYTHVITLCPNDAQVGSVRMIIRPGPASRDMHPGWVMLRNRG